MKVIKEIGIYLLLTVLVVSGVLSLFLLPYEISGTIVASIIAFGVFVGFCFILLLINRFIKHSTVKGGYSFEDFLNGRD